MCGITGKLYYDPDRPVERSVLEAMCQRLVHRGPDDWGVYRAGNVGLAMRRLAIIDVAGGHQPISNEDGTIWTIFNGEIYNFQELRQRLQARGHHFSTHTDTEVIVHLYEEHGEDFPRHLNGMFAIALWDTRQRRFMLVRDHLGIKPLYYAARPDRLLFGSEIKAIAAEGSPLSLDLTALSRYLSLLYIPAPHSIYQEIRKLEPGNSLIWRNGRLSVQPYWSLAAVRPRGHPVVVADLQAEFRALLADAVKRQLVADVPLGIFLSGGLDSSAVVALARQAHTGPLKTFAIGFDDASYDETAYARLAARAFDTEHTELIIPARAAEIAPKLVTHFDEPFADSSAVPSYYLAELTRRHVTVALGGDGGDELFAGYVTYQADKLARLYDRLPSLLTRHLLPATVRRLPVSDRKVSFDLKARRFVAYGLLEPGRRHYAWKAFFDDEQKRTLLTGDLLAALNGDLDGYPAFEQHYAMAPRFDDLSQHQYADCKVYLPDDVLTRVDRTSMAHSLEARVPILDYRVAEFAFSLPSHLRMPGLRLKHFLRESVRDLLPAPIVRKRKGGFNVPMSRWLKTDLRPLVDAYLSPATVRRQGYFEPSVVGGMIADHMAGHVDYSRNLWALLMFNVWAEHAAMPAPNRRAKRESNHQ